MKENILVVQPVISSQAALVILRRKLMLQDDSSRSVWLRFRKQYLESLMESGKQLTCAYCGRGPLEIEHPSVKMVATIDHVVPLSKGGTKFDPSNFNISCVSCNAKKADKLI